MKSTLEELLAAQLRAAGLAFKREHRLVEWRRWRFDFVVGSAYSAFFPIWDWKTRIGAVPNQVLVEVHGFGPQGRHGSWAHGESDAEKLSTAGAMGWRCLVVTGKMVRDGRALALIEAALGVRALEAPPVKPKLRRSRRTTGRPGRKGLNDMNLSLPLHVRKAAGLA